MVSPNFLVIVSQSPLDSHTTVNLDATATLLEKRGSMLSRDINRDRTRVKGRTPHSVTYMRASLRTHQWG
jgi:hypothetical protein